MQAKQRRAVSEKTRMKPGSPKAQTQPKRGKIGIWRVLRELWMVGCMLRDLLGNDSRLSVSMT